MQDTPVTIARSTAARPVARRPIAGHAAIVVALALLGGLGASSAACAQSTVVDGQKIAFDRSKGNCLTCH